LWRALGDNLTKRGIEIAYALCCYNVRMSPIQLKLQMGFFDLYSRPFQTCYFATDWLASQA